ncbi:beta-lactamase superfamily domain-containing protein [Flammula alnicola]|nr:beta-lactamase superfamily domain-containing protein [Flammula alnicola]
MSQKPAHHLESSGFQNPWPARATLLDSLATILRIPLSKARPFETPVEPAKTVACNFESYNSHEERKAKSIGATWLGHAGFLVQLPRLNEPDARPIRIIFDPIFAERASPSNRFGPRRYLPTPCEVKDLPGVDFVVISHNHYDHLDIECLRQICSLWTQVQFLVPLGVKNTLNIELILGEHRIREMDWWDSVSFPSPGEPTSSTTVEFVCTPAQHNSGRGLLDQRKSLWASWVVRQLPSISSSSHDVPPLASIYFAGDTGYSTADGPCPAFKEIGNKYGPFDLAMIPIWRGASLSILGRMGFRLTPSATETLLSTLHASPSDAIDVARDVRAKHSIAMHFGTFCGSEDEAKEPLVLLVEILQAKGLTWIPKGRGIWDEEGFGALDVGETVFIPV